MLFCVYYTYIGVAFEKSGYTEKWSVFFSAESYRRLSKLFLKQVVKMAKIGETTGFTDVKDIKVCLCQQIDGIVQTLGIDILGRCLP